MIAGELTTSSTETSERVSYVFPGCNPSGQTVSGDFSIFFFLGRTEAVIYRFCFACQVTGVYACCAFSSCNKLANATRTRMETQHQHISTVQSTQAGAAVL